MKTLSLVCIISAWLIVTAPADENSRSDGSQKKATPKAKKDGRQEALTGCVDEQEGKYVLLDDRMMQKLADLETAIASGEDVFAKHLGHKVIVKGNKTSGQESVFRVTSIEEVAAVCAPPQGGNPQ